MPDSLKLDPHFHDASLTDAGAYAAGDAFYEALTQAHAGLSDEQSHLLNARLLLILANHIGDVPVLKQAIATAREDLS